MFIKYIAVSLLTGVLLTGGTAVPKHHHHRHKKPSPVFVNAVASYYTGIGGACGIDTGKEVNGVANLYLPCGKWITVCYSRCKRVQVIDRGPAPWTGRQYDLTQNVAENIGFPLSRGVTTIKVNTR